MVNRPAHSSERALIVACARRDLDVASKERIRRALDDSISWEYLAHECRRQGLLPLVSSHLRAAFSDVVPGHAVASLREAFESNAAATLRLTDELVSILRILRASDVDALPYKGPALAMLAYGNIALRQSGDLDIFVRERDIGKAVSLLVGHGYLRTSLTPAREKALRRWGHHDLLMHARGTSIEIHWRTAKSVFSFGLDHDELWQRAETIHLAGDDVLTIGRNDLLLMLAVHGSTHSWRRLEWIVSYAELAKQLREDEWTGILKRARELRCLRIVLVIMLVASMVLDFPLPMIFEREARADPAARRIALKLQQRIFGVSDRMLGSVGYQFAVRSGLREKVRLAYASLFTPAHEDWEFVSLPDAFLPLYYAVRPMRLATEYLLRRG